MLMSVTTYYAVTLFGLVSGTLALVLRQAEMRHPAPGDIQAKGGLGHMLVGVFAGLALVSIAVVAIFATGIILPIIVATTLLLAGRFIDTGGALTVLYPYQLTLAIAATVAALLLWLNLITLILGEPNA